MIIENNNDEKNPVKSIEHINNQQECAEISMDGMFARQEDFLKKLENREVVKVKVVHVNKECILVDIGQKKEGLISVSEFENSKIPAVGSEIIAVLEKRGGERNSTLLSHKKAIEALGFEQCLDCFEKHERVKGIICEKVKGGYMVEVNGVKGFMPLSLSELHLTYKHHLPDGARIKCEVIELDKHKKRMVVSRRKVLEEDEKKRRQKVLSEVRAGKVLRVVVSRAGRETLFLRYHGIEGFVRLNDVSWKSPLEAIKTYKRGQRLKAKLINLDKENSTLQFGLKQLYPNPADILRKKYPPRSTVKAKIISVNENGVKVSVALDTDGFVPTSELVSDLKDKIGQTISAAVLGINKEKFELNLSVKRYEEIQNRKIMAQYLKEAPRPTLGQLLSGGESE